MAAEERPVLTKEQRDAKFWIKPGVFVVRKVDDHPIMSVDYVQSTRRKQPDGSFRNWVEGVWCRWVDAEGRPQRMRFQIKELMKYESPRI